MVRIKKQVGGRRSGVGVGPAMACVAAWMAVAAAVSAQVPDPGFQARVDLFQASLDSSVRFDSRSLGVGTDLDLESDLGVEDEADIVRAELTFRTGERSHLMIDYLSMSRDGQAIVGRQFQFGDSLFSATADVASSVDTDFAAIGWRYDFLPDPRTELGLSLSVAWLSFDAAVRGPVSVAGVGSIVVEESGSVEGPLPMLGLHWSTWFGDRFRLSASGRYLEVSDLSGWSGSALDAGARFEWFVTPNFAVGLGYSTTELEAASNDAEDDGLTKADASFDGFRAGVTIAF